MAWISSMTPDPTGKIGIFTLIMLIVSSAVSGIFTSWQNPTEKIGFSMTAALGITLVMLLSGIIISAGKLSGGAFMNYGCYFSIYTLFSYLGSKGKGRRRKRKMRR
jgi:ribose/xylose/arabinose/galactoside ABC-type transport system permease subunit